MKELACTPRLHRRLLQRCPAAPAPVPPTLPAVHTANRLYCQSGRTLRTHSSLALQHPHIWKEIFEELKGKIHLEFVILSDTSTEYMRVATKGCFIPNDDALENDPDDSDDGDYVIPKPQELSQITMSFVFRYDHRATPLLLLSTWNLMQYLKYISRLNSSPTHHILIEYMIRNYCEQITEFILDITSQNFTVS